MCVQKSVCLRVCLWIYVCAENIVDCHERMKKESKNHKTTKKKIYKLEYHTLNLFEAGEPVVGTFGKTAT